MTQSNRARKRTTAPPHTTDTAATALTGIVSNEQRLARKGTTSGQGNDAARVTVAGRLLGGATTIAMMVGIAFTGTAQANAAPEAQAPTLAANGVQPYGDLKDFGPGTQQQFVKPLVGMSSTPQGKGYWLAASDGGVFSYGDAEFHGSTGDINLVEPVTAIVSTPSGDGYWLAAKDGGVFSFGDAKFRGSAAGVSAHNIVGIAATKSGRGYWLAAKDGGVFSFGDAKFRGSAAGISANNIVGIAATKSGRGYTLVASDGGVFAFGDAKFQGGAYATIPNDAVGITTIGRGYAIVRETGSVLTFGTSVPSIADAKIASSEVTTVGIAATTRGYWTLQAGRSSLVDHMNPFLVCTRKHESSPNAPGYDDGYAAVNPNGRYFGAYQFGQPTWNNTARHAGRPDLIGVNPSRASVQDQDELAWDLFLWQGYAPWENRCRGLR